MNVATVGIIQLLMCSHIIFLLGFSKLPKRANRLFLVLILWFQHQRHIIIWGRRAPTWRLFRNLVCKKNPDVWVCIPAVPPPMLSLLSQFYNTFLMKLCWHFKYWVLKVISGRFQFSGEGSPAPQGTPTPDNPSSENVYVKNRIKTQGNAWRCTSQSIPPPKYT